MATIIREARDPWWANLAVNVLGGLWNDYQQREANKKANAYVGEFMNQLQTLGNSGQQSATPSQGAGQGLLSAPDNDANGWASAFHKTDNPLTQYDTGVMGLLGASPTPTLLHQLQQRHQHPQYQGRAQVCLHRLIYTGRLWDLLELRDLR